MQSRTPRVGRVAGNRSARAVVLVILAWQFVPAGASFAQDDWTAGNGNWSTPANWSAGVPGSGANVDIEDSNGVSRTVTYNYTGPAVSLDQLNVDLTGGSGSATNTLSMSANNLSSADTEFVGFSGSGTITQTGGINNTFDLDLGVGSGANGQYNLSGIGSLQSGGEETIGGDGSATFTQTGGTNNIGAEEPLGSGGLLVGANQSGQGHTSASYNLGGGSLTVGVEELIGAEGATGTFTQTGGTHAINGDLDIGPDPGANGYVGLSGGSLSANNVYVGGFFNYFSGGQGTFSVSGTGSATVTGTLLVYNTTGTSLNLSGGTITTGSLDLSGNPALLNWTSGTLDLTNSSVIIDNSANDWNGFSSLTLNSSMTLEVGGNEIVGSTGAGTFTVAGGANYAGNGLSVGYGNGSNGNYTLSYGSLSSNGSEVIGGFGIGTFNQYGGVNNFLAGDLSIASYGGSRGSYSLSGGTLSVSGNAYVGGYAYGPGGTGLLTVSNTAQLSVTGTLQVYAAGTVNIDGGTSSIGGLSIATGGVVDINDTLVINYGSGNPTPMATILAYLQSGYAAGKWNGPGITSSTAAANPLGSTTLGWADNGSQITISYTWVGDTDLNGKVNYADLSAMVPGATNATWSEGDFNYDGKVNQDDYSLFMLGLAESGGVNISTTLPEPSKLLATGFWLLAPSSRRRRKMNIF